MRRNDWGRRHAETGKAPDWVDADGWREREREVERGERERELSISDKY